jgi:hypothetical protein
MTSDVLLCSDLDRTILPNGPQPESPAARPLLRHLANRPELTLAYVSGRHRALLERAIDEYRLPLPHYAIGDVGTTIYQVEGEDWRPWDDWYDEIAPDWGDNSREDLHARFADVGPLRLQEADKQNVFKLSYYAPVDIDAESLVERLRARLRGTGIGASLIWSVDEMIGRGLLDVLPERATKLHAIEFLMQRKGFVPERTVFAGDSGNDLAVLTSGLQAVLVRNARADVREQALRAVRSSGRSDCLYLAKGSLFGMNGNYSAGVLEGLVHFLPHTLDWLRDAAAAQTR